MELSAAAYRARWAALGRGHRGRLLGSAGHFAAVSVKLPQRAVELGHARIESLPDGPALRWQRRRIGNARRERGPRRRRDQLHDRRRVTPDYSRCRIPSGAAGYLVSAILLE